MVACTPGCSFHISSIASLVLMVSLTSVLFKGCLQVPTPSFLYILGRFNHSHNGSECYHDYPWAFLQHIASRVRKGVSITEAVLDTSVVTFSSESCLYKSIFYLYTIQAILNVVCSCGLYSSTPNNVVMPKVLRIWQYPLQYYNC